MHQHHYVFLATRIYLSSLKLSQKQQFMSEVENWKLLSRINRIREAGLIKRWKEVFWPRNDECDLRGSGDANVIKVFLADMQGSFYILGMGKHLTLMEGDSSARAPGLSWLGIWVFHCLPSSAWADGNLAEGAGQINNMVEKPNPYQPNQGPQPPESPCSLMCRNSQGVDLINITFQDAYLLW